MAVFTFIPTVEPLGRRRPRIRSIKFDKVLRSRFGMIPGER